MAYRADPYDGARILERHLNIAVFLVAEVVWIATAK